MLLFILLIIFPLQVLGAEVLQVRSSSLLQVGDQNRSYTVKIACMEVKPAFDADVMNWLKLELPRKTRVNLRPQSSFEGVLLARVIKIPSQNDISKDLVSL